MQFVCRDCGKASSDIDRVLDGACECGGTHFKLVSEETPMMPSAMSEKEEIRRDLHRWLDLNIDSMNQDDVSNIRVVFECADESKLKR
jgi:predicted  nucleic acid-binding Zn-ribbon protein